MGCSLELPSLTQNKKKDSTHENVTDGIYPGVMDKYLTYLFTPSLTYSLVMTWDKWNTLIVFGTLIFSWFFFLYPDRVNPFTYVLGFTLRSFGLSCHVIFLVGHTCSSQIGLRRSYQKIILSITTTTPLHFTMSVKPFVRSL